VILDIPAKEAAPQNILTAQKEVCCFYLFALDIGLLKPTIIICLANN
jgi:hypothetical protein